MNIPATCLAAVVVNEGPDFTVDIRSVEVPDPGADEILVRLNASGLCASDLHYMIHDTHAPPMSKFGVKSAGHEGCGIVVKVGPRVSTFAVGDRAGVKPIWSTCGVCELCIEDKETHCAKKVNTGLTTTGTFQHYILANAKHAIKIPRDVSDDLAATLMCNGATAYRSVLSADLPPSSCVVILGGGGGVGSQIVQVAKALGLRPIVVDISAKRAASLSDGAEAFVDILTSGDPVAEVLQLTDGGAHGVFVTAPQAYKKAIDYVGGRVGAVVMCIALPAVGSDHIISADPNTMVLQQMTIKGSLVGTRADTVAILKLAQRGLIRPNSHSVALEKLPEMIQLMKEAKLNHKVVVDFNM